jgi:DNA-binding transcriptional LysR family regulator
MSAVHGLPEDLNSLLVLEALYVERSVTRAAKRLALTQSAVSHRLRALREHFGDMLFVASRDGLLPTELALALEMPLRRALDSLRLALDPAVFDPATTRRRFSIATTDLGEVLMMPALEKRLLEVAPGASVSLQRIGPDILDRLRDGKVDIATLPHTMALGPTIMTRLMSRDEFVLMARRGHPELGRARRISFEKYLSLRHVLVSPRDSDRGLVEDVLDGLGRRRQLAVITRHFLSGACIVASTDLVQTAPTQLAAIVLDLMALQVRGLPFSMPESKVMLAWHERSHGDAGHRWLREELARAGQALQHSFDRRFARWIGAPDLA